MCGPRSRGEPRGGAGGGRPAHLMRLALDAAGCCCSASGGLGGGEEVGVCGDRVLGAEAAESLEQRQSTEAS
jgi:hypothetical protein